MPRYGVNILKRVGFRSGTQHFGNTYYYNTNIPAGDLTGLNLLVDEVVAKEKAMHATDVTFVKARLWSQIGTKEQNNMIIDKTLSGNGAVTADDIDRERAFLIRFRAGNDSRGRPVYLRKWYHLLTGAVGGVAVGLGAKSNKDPLAAGIRAALEVFGNSIKSFTASGENVELVSKNGRQITGATTAHQFYEHHQMGDEWRGT